MAGLGEASPLPNYSPDRIEEAEEQLQFFLSSISEIPESPDEIFSLCAAISSPSARFAAEAAMLDLLARSRNLPLHRLFFSSSTEVARSGLLQEISLENRIEEAHEKVSRNLQCLKIKIGILPIQEELRQLQALSASLGPHITLRLDANASLSPVQFQELLVGSRGLPIDVIEEPTTVDNYPWIYDSSKYKSRWKLDGTSLPLLAVDESLQSHAVAHLGASEVGALVLKPALLGVGGALQLAKEGVRRGKKLIVTHLFDGPIALAACCELALALPPEALLPCGLDEHGALHSLGNQAVPQLRIPGRITRAYDVGLGLDV